MSSNKPLAGYRVLVTRAADQAGEFSEKLSELGATAVELPLISISPPDSWDKLDDALTNTSKYGWIIFASQNAVDSCLKRLALLCLDPSELNKAKLASIGPSTEQALAIHGLTCAFSPSKFVGESLVEEFPGYPNLAGTRILWPRTNIGRNFVIEQLTASGAQIDAITCYKTSGPEDPEKAQAQLFELIAEEKIDIITLMSSQTARNCGDLIKNALVPHRGTEADSSKQMQDFLAKVLIASIGPETTKSCRDSLGKTDIQAEKYTEDGLLDALVRFLGQKH